MTLDPVADSTTTTTAARDPSPAPAPTPAAGPDWSALPGDLLGPLCEYNLRGLADPRCPECGYRFDWDALLNADRTRHPYLFEHHPRNNVWSFFRTILAGLRPARFWRTLQPIHTPRPGRLVLYWVLSLSLTLLAAAASFAVHVRTLEDRLSLARAQTVAFFNSPFSQGRWKRAVLNTYGSAQAYANATYPSMDKPEFWRMALRSCVDRGEVAGGVYLTATPAEELRFVVGVYALWPWLTVATLLIFRTSMHRAGIRAVHVLRVALYACDAAWLAVGVAVVVLPGLIPAQHLRVFGSANGPHMIVQILTVAFLAAFTSWRLSAAYRHYLRFDRPLATVAAAQLIVLLAVVVFILNT